MSVAAVESLAMPTLPPAPIANVIEHWANARIDSPRALIERFDSAAKQMIAVGGLLQTAYLGFLAFGNLRDHAPWLLLILPFVGLVGTVWFAASVVCTVPVQMEAYETFRLMESGASEMRGSMMEEAFQRWCLQVDTLAAKKRDGLHRSNICFTATVVATLVLVAVMLWH